MSPTERLLICPPGEGPGVCSTCRGPAGADAQLCRSCARLPGVLDAVVPISLSPAGSEIARHLRAYKDDPSATERDASRRTLSEVLGCFLDLHLRCLAERAGARGFEVVCTVPSCHANCGPSRLEQLVTGMDRSTREHHARLLEPGPSYGAPRVWSPDRFRACEQLHGDFVLLIDDTWTSGASAQAAAHALHLAGAGAVGLVVIGRHVQHADAADVVGAAAPFTWDRCALVPRCLKFSETQDRARGLAPGGRT